MVKKMIEIFYVLKIVNVKVIQDHHIVMEGIKIVINIHTIQHKKVVLQIIWRGEYLLDWFQKKNLLGKEDL